jgi:hypothetical protein
MALVERLMGLEGDDNKIAVHAFFAAVGQVARGRLTLAQVKNYLALDAAAAAELDALAALAPVGSTATAIANRALYISDLHEVFILAEAGAPGYDTPAGVRARLGL